MNHFPFRTQHGFDGETPHSRRESQYWRPPEEEEGASMSLKKEPMFEKPLTPSDVGKLNRLVIPKQHAEKYFPLDGGAGEKGLLLSFEDEGGRPWRFRYSYWSSSQSYVLTKGWSRFVKEKQLDAGDVVFFLRQPANGGLLYIGCRRQGSSAATAGDFPAATPAAPASSKKLRLFGVNLECGHLLSAGSTL